MKKYRKKEALLLGSLLEKIAPRIGATVIIEPEWRFVGQITFRSGRRSYFRYNTLDLNPIGASDIAKDKDWANFFMKSMGYPVVPNTKAFYEREWAKTIRRPRRDIDGAYRYARRLGFPVVVKPNSGSQGTAVEFVHTRADFYKAMRAIFAKDRVALVQRPVSGKDYRLVVLDTKVVSAYQRLPLSIIGDGRRSIERLLMDKHRQFVALNRDTQIRKDDPRLIRKLARQGLTLNSIPEFGVRVFLLDNANLSAGGDAVDVTDSVHPTFRELAVQLTAEMGLRLCGVDIMIDGDIHSTADRYWILEINAAPGLDHYARVGKAQEEIVESLYLEILKHLDN
jgi:D-alanine-D-alanine ligase-like ATP-grasp enzyme